ncbi:autoinducer binding domain-containing protein [Tsuneonella flava]|uniref:Autoinducer binding domain-containing protein n=1 Tax=Tsuneonella flava TaxID=2055955 RepID=A0ABX7K9V8_9SPHN|nr:LuxR family transcriptional regulator [Tsuneonella flava]QSB44747.1 autoinducer binding domain-containing protein [Tsuneonella flava]
MQKLLVDYISRMEAADSFDQKWDCLTDTLRTLGFNVVNYTVFPNTETYENPVFIENFRNGWVEHYTAQDYGPEDALIPHVLESDIPALMLGADERQPLQWSTKGRQLIAEAKDAGMERAIGFSHNNGDGIVDGGIAIGTDMMSAHDFSTFLNERVPLLYIIYSIAYGRLHPERRQRIALDELKISSRQYDLLMALWGGLSNKQIAERLGVSEVTVSFHLKQLRSKLGCSLNREIIPKAYHYGLIGAVPRLNT